MNKKQLIVAWIMGVLLSWVFYDADYTLQSGIRTLDSKFFRFPLTDVFRFGMPILIIGGLLIYTLKNKK